MPSWATQDGTAATPASPFPSSPFPSSSAFVRPVTFRGQLVSSGAVDLRHDTSAEDTIESYHDFTMRLRYQPNERWTVVMEGHLSWWLTGSGPVERSVFAPTTWQGNAEMRLRDMYVGARFGRWLVRLGNQIVVWGSGDVLRPADVVNPQDLRRGFLGNPDTMRIPIPMASATYVRDEWQAQLLVIPFFVPNRVQIFGNDNALLRSGSPFVGAIPVDPLIGGLIHPSMEDVVQPALLQTELPEELPRNGSIGARITRSAGGLDLSFGYLFAWERMPTVRWGEGVREGLEELAVRLPGLVLPGDRGPGLPPDGWPPDGWQPGDPLPPGQLPPGGFAPGDALQGWFDGPGNGNPLLRAAYQRRHIFEVDGVKYFGPIGLRFESVFSPLQTAYTTELRSIRRPTSTSTLGLSYEGFNGDVVVVAEGFYQRVFTRPDDAQLLAIDRDFYGGALVLRWGLGSLVRLRETRWQDLSFQMATFYAAVGRDLVVAPAVSFRVNERLEVSSGCLVIQSFNRSRASLGDALGNNDQCFARLNTTF